MDGGAVVAAILLLSSWLTSHAIGTPLRRLAEAVRSIAAGEASKPVGDRDRTDEIGRIAQALEELRATVNRAFAQSQMLEQMSVGVMMAEPSGELRIQYVNPQARASLEKAAEGFPALTGEPVGKSLDCFHEKPEHIRTVFADPDKPPHRSRIHVGREVMDIQVSAIRDGQGHYVGPMMLWTEVTA
nr:HAMP domain-containing protein [Roseococcus sp. MDT2-1-1]